MRVFDAYANYYNLLYNDKHYQAEADYVDSVIKNYHPKTTSILDLGCGTGRHALALAQKGYQVHGIDISKRMIDSANKIKKNNPDVAKLLSFSIADLRTLHLNKKFDTIVSLFHVMSYQTADQDLHQAFNAAYEHLNPGGLFIFDFWYGPAVQSQQPHLRIKRMHNDDIAVTRITEPTHAPEKHTVDVDFTVFVKNKKTHDIQELHETHVMRYLFKPEVEQLCEHHNFNLLAFHELITEKQPTSATWGVCAIGQKK